MGLADWWYFTGTVTKAVAIAGVVAMAVLALALIAPHVQLLKPIAQWFGLVEVEYVNETVYVNKTVPIYINQTVPVYVNRTVYVPVPVNSTSTLGTAFNALASLAGICNGRIVVLPNNTAWFVAIWLVSPKYLISENPIIAIATNGLAPNNRTVFVTYYNTTTHYAQYLFTLGAWAFVSLNPNPWQASITGINWICYLQNVTVNGYYVAVCGDTPGVGPLNLLFGGLNIVNGSLMQYTTTVSPALTYGMNSTGYFYVMPRLNTTYTGIVYFLKMGPTQDVVAIPGPICNLTLTYAPNATAALWLPITTNQTFIKYLRESGIEVFGSYNPYDWTMGYWVWYTPS